MDEDFDYTFGDDEDGEQLLQMFVLSIHDGLP
jgi:hypothetical protein